MFLLVVRSEVGVDEVGEVVGDEVGGYEVLSGVRWMR